jgi:uncharacterized protein involved in exopolysaccharide biosynthesis
MTPNQGQVTSFSVLDVLRGMGRRGILITSCTALGLLAGLGVVSAFAPAYQAESRVLIDDLATPYDQANINQLQNPRDSQIDERIIKSQVAVIESRDLVQRVVESLQLGERSEFDPLRSGVGKVSALLIKFGFGDDPRAMTVEERALDRLYGKLTVYQVPDSNVIAIKYVAQDGKTAADVANTLAQTYVLSTREASSGSTGRAREWLSGQIDGLRSKVAASDAAVEKYRAEKGLFRTRETTLGAQEISELNTQITLAEAAASEAKARAAEIRDLLASKGSVDASADVLNSPTIQALRATQVSATRKVSELSATYLPNHPRMQAAQKEVSDVDRQIRREALKIVDGLQGQAKVAAARAKSLRDSLEEMKGRQGSSLQDEVKLKELEREAKANRDQLEAMLARFADTNTRQDLDLQPGFARIIQQAAVPSQPYFPRFGPTILLTTLIGLGLGLGLAFLLEIMNQAARLALGDGGMSGEERRPRPTHAARVGRAAVPVVPDLPLEEPPVSAQSAPAPAAPAFTTQAEPALATIPFARTHTEARALLAAAHVEADYGLALQHVLAPIATILSSGKARAIAVASVGAGHEAAVTTLALAQALAGSGKKTILLDLDSRHALIPDLMELSYAPGLGELVSGQADFARVIQKDTASSLQIIRRGNAAAPLGQRMEGITRTLSGIYEAVIVYAGDAAPEALSHMRGCQAAVLISPAARLRNLGPAAQTLRSQGISTVIAIKVDGFLQQAA